MNAEMYSRLSTAVGIPASLDPGGCQARDVEGAHDGLRGALAAFRFYSVMLAMPSTMVPAIW